MQSCEPGWSPMITPPCSSDTRDAPIPAGEDYGSYAVTLGSAQQVVYGAGPLAFELVFHERGDYRKFLAADLYSVAKGFIEGRFDVHGDLIRAIAFKFSHPGTALRKLKGFLLALASSFRLEALLQSKLRAKRNVEFHYDRSNEFYAAFLDPRMVYSCAYFQTAGQSLADAQLSKLDLICRKLDLRPHERFLDIGCGWGALLLRAAEKYGAQTFGCTLSTRQVDYAGELARAHGLAGQMEVRKADFRDIKGIFDKIASVGMFEHVGRKRLRRYFSRVFQLLSPDGLFLNHGIVRPQGVGDGPETRFLRNYVFPGGELAHLAEVIRAAEDAGFEVLDVENLRPHYAITCRHWVERLMDAEPFCLKAAGRQTYRTWLLYLSASSLSFQRGQTDVCQILLAKRGGPTRRLTRDYLLGA